MPPSRIVDQNVDPSEPFDRSLDEHFRIMTPCHIGRDGERDVPGTVDLVGQLFELFLPAGSQDDRSPFPRDLHGKSRPYSRRGACYDCDFSVEHLSFSRV